LDHELLLGRRSLRKPKALYVVSNRIGWHLADRQCIIVVRTGELGNDEAAGSSKN